MSPKVFISYCHKDATHQEKLAVHLAPLVRDGLSVTYDGNITPGADIDAAIRRQLREASIFVALASPHYLQSEYCFVKEFGYARRRAARKTMFVVAAIIRPCRWKGTRMARYKNLPRDGKAVTLWANRDAAFEDIVDGLRKVIAEAQKIELGAAKRASPSRRIKDRAKTIHPTSASRTKPGRPPPKRKAAGTAKSPARRKPTSPKPMNRRSATAKPLRERTPKKK